MTVSPNQEVFSHIENTLEIAIGWGAQGRAVFPIWPVDPRTGHCTCPLGEACQDKHPILSKNLESASTERLAIIKLWRRASYRMKKVCEEQKRPWHGLQPAIGGGTQGLIVLDIDSQQGYDEWAAIQAKHGAAPATQTTASGRVLNDRGLHGAHIAFKIPEHLDPEKRQRLTIWGGGNLDGRANGKGWTVLPPSWHRSGHRYVITNNAPIAVAPDWLVDYALDCIAKAKGRKRLNAAKKAAEKPQAPSFDLEPLPPEGTWLHDWAYGVWWKPSTIVERETLMAALGAADPDSLKGMKQRPSIDRQTWLGVIWSLRAHDRWHRDGAAHKIALWWSRQFASHTDESFYRTVWNRESEPGQPHVGLRRIFDLADQNMPGWRAGLTKRSVDAATGGDYVGKASVKIGAAGATPSGTGAAGMEQASSPPNASPAQMGPMGPMGGMGGSGGMGGGNGSTTPPPSPEHGPALLLSKADPSTSAEQFHKKFTPTLMRTNDEFLVWRGGAYTEMEDAAVKSKVQAMLDHAVSRAKDKESGESIQVKFLPKSKDIAEVVSALQNKFHRDALDRPQWLPGYSGPDAANLISFPNCILDTTTGKTYDPTPGLFTRNVLAFPYSKDAKATPNWLNFLGSIFSPETRDEKIRQLRQMFGYLLTGRTDLHKMFMLLGLPRSGKSLIGRVLDALIGEKNIYSTSFTRMTERFGTEGFIGKSLVAFPDAHTGQRTDRDTAVEMLKSISGEDKQSIDRKHKKAWQGVVGARFLVTANAMPDFADVSGAFASRFIIIQTDISFEGRENTTLFEDLLVPELPAIMNWSLDGAVDLRQTGKFLEPESSKQLKRTMDAINNPVLAFAQERLTFEKDAEISKKDIFSAFRQWCIENGVKEMSAQRFGKILFTVSRNTLKGYGDSDFKIRDETGKRVNAYGGVRFST